MDIWAAVAIGAAVGVLIVLLVSLLFCRSEKFDDQDETEPKNGSKHGGKGDDDVAIIDTNMTDSQDSSEDGRDRQMEEANSTEEEGEDDEVVDLANVVPQQKKSVDSLHVTDSLSMLENGTHKRMAYIMPQYDEDDTYASGPPIKGTESREVATTVDVHTCTSSSCALCRNPKQTTFIQTKAFGPDVVERIRSLPANWWEVNGLFDMPSVNMQRVTKSADDGDQGDDDESDLIIRCRSTYSGKKIPLGR